MPIWDIISTALNNIPGSSDWWSNIDSSSYTSTIGDQTSFVLGGTQAYNAIGSSINLTADWEESLSYLSSRGNPSLLGGSMLGLVARGLVFGIGGNADLVVGNDSSFNYCGESFSVNRNRHEFTCTVPPDSHAPMPTAVKCTLGLGIFGLLASSITARILYNLNGVDNSTVDGNNLLMELIPELESTWLEILKLVEFCQSVLASLQTDIETARTCLQSAEAAFNSAFDAETAATKAGSYGAIANLLTAKVSSERYKVENYQLLLNNGLQAQKSDLSALIARQKDALANPQSPLVTQVTADQYDLISNSIMATTQKGPILLMAQDYQNPLGTDAYGGITLNASQLGFTAQGSASITMNRQGFNTNLPPGISLMTMGDTSSAISLIAQQKTAASPMASITSSTDGITLSFGSNVPANSFTTQMSSTGVTIKQNLENGPQIQLGVDSIKLSVGNSSLTINNNGITINATSVQVISGNSKLSMANGNISTQVGDVSNQINETSHTLTAVESKLSVSNTAIGLSAATQNIKIDANTSLQQTMVNNQVDGVANNQAALNQNNA